MAVITYTQDAVLGAYQQWLMQQGALACLERRIIGQEAPDCAVQQGMVRAQAGSLLRFSVLTTLASANVFFAGQFLSDVGMWQNVGETVNGTSAGGIDQVVRPATAGCYKNMVASVGTALVAGSEVYVLVELGRTNNGQFTPYAVLLSGYVRTNEPIDSSGGSKVNNPPSTGGGGGCCLETVLTDSWDPDTDNPYTILVTAGANARLIYLEFGFVTSAVAGNRRQYLLLSPPSGFGFEVFSIIDQPASTSYGYTFQAGGPEFSDLSQNRYFYTLPESLWFSGNILVAIQASNKKAGDAWSFTSATYAEKGP